MNWIKTKTWVGFLFFVGNATAATIDTSTVALPSYFNRKVEAGTITLYAGRADFGNLCANASGSTTPCDSCLNIATLASGTTTSGGTTYTTGPFCNRNGVVSNLVFEVSFTVPTGDALPTTARVVMVNGTTVLSGTTTFPVGGTIVRGGTVTAQFVWTNICGNFSGTTAGDSSCDTSFSKTLTVGISKDGTSTLTDSFALQLNFRSINSSVNLTALSTQLYHSDCANGATAIANEGICSFQIKPGDSKVVIYDLGYAGTWPTPPADSSGITYSGMMVYYRAAPDPASQPDWSILAPGDTTGSTFEVPIDVDDTGVMSTARITGLTNDQNYVFAVGTLDQAGNVTQFTDVTNAAATFFTNGLTHFGMPGQVVGLLENKKCFIATAAFGSEMAPQVDLLRKFRNRFMLTNDWGQSLVKTYYRWSPPLAEFISQHRFIRAIVRMALWPIIIWAELSLEYGFWTGMFLLFASVLFSLELTRRMRQITRVIRQSRTR